MAYDSSITDTRHIGFTISNHLPNAEEHLQKQCCLQWAASLKPFQFVVLHVRRREGTSNEKLRIIFCRFLFSLYRRTEITREGIFLSVRPRFVFFLFCPLLLINGDNTFTNQQIHQVRKEISLERTHQRQPELFKGGGGGIRKCP